MTRTLHSLTAFLFYVLGAGSFAAFVLLRNGLYDAWPAWWLTVVKMPLLLTGLIYGGTSIYLSLMAAEDRPSRGLGAVIVVPILLLFLLSLFLNFRHAIPL